MPRRRALQLALICALLLPFAHTADAQIVRACAMERQHFCSAVPAGGGRIVRCLRANAAQASPMCMQAMQAGPAMRVGQMAMQGRPGSMGRPYAQGQGMAAMSPGSPPAPAGPRPGRAIVHACAMERHHFCSTLAAGGGRIVRCLRANAAHASPICSRALQAGPAMRGGPGAMGPGGPGAMSASPSSYAQGQGMAAPPPGMSSAPQQ